VTRLVALVLIVGMLGLAACKEEKAEAPPPRGIPADAVGQFCGMTLSEHPGPKGQIFVRSKPDPLWFASVRELFAFTMLPEYPKDVVALYVTDMADARDWDQPQPGPWIDAKRAVYVIGSRRRSGMDTDELVPFGNQASAQRFAAEQGGHAVSYADVPQDAVFPSQDERP
jgi:copper chaperone NosL